MCENGSIFDMQVLLKYYTETPGLAWTEFRSPGSLIVYEFLNLAAHVINGQEALKNTWVLPAEIDLIGVLHI